MSLKVKRILALCVCCVLLAVAIYQNIRHDTDSENVNAENAESEDVIFVQDYNSEEAGATDGEDVPTGILCDSPVDYIAGLRIEREAERSAFAEECMAIIKDTSSDESDILEAQDEMLSVTSMADNEDALESVLKSRGYEDVYVEYDDDGCLDIVLIAKNVTASEIDMIASVVYSETDVSSEYITVSSVY